MFLRAHQRSKDGKEHTYWSLVEMVRTPEGPRQRTLCYLGELNDSAQARWWKTIEVFNEQGESRQLKLFPSHVEVPEDDPHVARVLINQVRLERARQFGNCWLGLELWKRLGLDHFFEEVLDQEPAEVPWSRIAAVLAVNRLVPRAANWPSRSVGIPRRRWMTFWELPKARSTIRGCTAAWIGCCRRSRNWSSSCGSAMVRDRKSTRLNSSHGSISYAVFCLKKKKTNIHERVVLDFASGRAICADKSMRAV